VVIDEVLITIISGVVVGCISIVVIIGSVIGDVGVISGTIVLSVSCLWFGCTLI